MLSWFASLIRLCVPADVVKEDGEDPVCGLGLDTAHHTDQLAGSVSLSVRPFTPDTNMCFL